MNNKTAIVILPEDKVVLNQDQLNLITLALEKQLPVEDTALLGEMQKHEKTRYKEIDVLKQKNIS